MMGCVRLLSWPSPALNWLFPLQFCAIVNINLALVNVLPLPALDGGYLLLLALEALRGGKKLPQKVEQVGQWMRRMEPNKVTNSLIGMHNPAATVQTHPMQAPAFNARVETHPG
jgi:hypothetical protein